MKAAPQTGVGWAWGVGARQTRRTPDPRPPAGPGQSARSHGATGITTCVFNLHCGEMHRTQKQPF